MPFPNPQKETYSMYFSKKRNAFEASNLRFYPDTGCAYSYRWYKILDRIDGKYVLNVHNYSRTTGRHVSKIRSLLTNELKKEIYLVVDCPKGLMNRNYVVMAIENQIKELENILANPRSKKHLMKDRLQKIQTLKDTLFKYKQLVASEDLNFEMQKLFEETA